MGEANFYYFTCLRLRVFILTRFLSV